MRRSFPSFLAFALLAACAPKPPARFAAGGPPPGDVLPPGGVLHFGRPFVSPMGEPFFGADGQSGDTLWFAQADRDHDGRLTSIEMEADAARFFATLDINHDGEIDPDEIDRYETEIAPFVQVGIGPGPGAGRRGGQGSPPGGGRGKGGGGMGGGGMGGGGMGGGGGGGMGGGGRMGGGEGGSSGSTRPAYPMRQGAARFGYLALPEPVIAADTNFDRGVSRQEFAAAARARFALLDRDHDGRIDPAELPALPTLHR